MRDWRGYLRRGHEKPCETVLAEFRITDVNTRKRFLRTLFAAPCIALKTAPVPTESTPSVLASAILLNAHYANGGKPFAPTEAFVAASQTYAELYQTKITKDAIITAMQGVHMDLQRFVHKFHPLNTVDPSAVGAGVGGSGRPKRVFFHSSAAQNHFVVFALQAMRDLGFGLLSLFNVLGLRHGDIKLDNAGVRFDVSTLANGEMLTQFSFRWLDMDCASQKTASNRDCSPYHDPLPLDRSQTARADRRFHEDIFRFSVMMMRLWSGRGFDRKSSMDNPPPLSGGSVRVSGSSRDWDAGVVRPRRPLKMPSTEQAVNDNLRLVQDDKFGRAPTRDILGNEYKNDRAARLLERASELAHLVMELQSLRDNRRRRFETVLEELDDFLRDDATRVILVNPCEKSTVFSRAWRSTIDPTFTLFMYPQWSC
jgi:hypothetical protein